MLKAVVALVIEDTHLISLWEYYWLNEHVALMQYQMCIFASCVFSCISAATFLVSPMVVNFPMYFGGFSSKLGGIFQFDGVFSVCPAPRLPCIFP